MTDSGAQAREDQFLGALLGLAIGDALGRPLRGLSAAEISTKYGVVDGYITDDDGDHMPGQQGEITDKSEIVLCLVESLTTNEGHLDPENINARMGFLAAGASRTSMSEATVNGIELAEPRGGLVGLDYQPEPELAVAVRGVPVGLVHAVGGYDDSKLVQEAEIVSRLTHAGDDQSRATANVARAVNVAARRRLITDIEARSESAISTELKELMDVLRSSGSFHESVSAAVALGGETDSKGAIAGAVAGARFGASGIRQDLIDGLDARIYLTLAAPWFYRTAVRRAGTVIDLRLIQ